MNPIAYEEMAINVGDSLVDDAGNRMKVLDVTEKDDIKSENKFREIFPQPIEQAKRSDNKQLKYKIKLTDSNRVHHIEMSKGEFDEMIRHYTELGFTAIPNRKKRTLIVTRKK